MNLSSFQTTTVLILDVECSHWNADAFSASGVTVPLKPVADPLDGVQPQCKGAQSQHCSLFSIDSGRIPSLVGYLSHFARLSVTQLLLNCLARAFQD